MSDSCSLSVEFARSCPFRPTVGQIEAMDAISAFIDSDAPRKAFVLNGYAGTGKTTLVGVLVRAMAATGRRVVLLAPTGRAAKVFSLYAGVTAYTIHKRIYRQKSVLDQYVFSLDRNICENTLFLVDEASMISDSGLSGAMFGIGRLLDDLVSYVYSACGCSMLLLGDNAQLPPVGELRSPALDAEVLRSYGLSVTSFTLTEVVRQDNESGILHNATLIRNLLASVPASDCCGVTPPRFRFALKGYADVRSICGSELVGTLSDCYAKDGTGGTIVLCRSNRRAIVYNDGIRRTILDREDELTRDDGVMIVKNNYFWTEREQAAASAAGMPLSGIPPFIANGDMAVVRRVRRVRELYGFRFATALLTFPDYDDYEIEATVMLDTLHSEAPSLTREQQDLLFNNVMEDYSDIRDRRKRMLELRENTYFNALQIKYAYAVTCHKAQGGQWSNVFIDQGYVPDGGQDAEYFRWLYTALTRATGTVYLVNWPADDLILS